MTPILEDFGWTAAQAEGALRDMPATWGTGRRSRLLKDWCSAHGRIDPTSLEARMRFLNWELKTTMGKLGAELREAKTAAEAAEAVAPYWTLLRSEGA
jgi:hypothetical protein